MSRLPACLPRARLSRRQMARLSTAAVLAHAAGRSFGWATRPAVSPRFSCMLWTLEKSASFPQCLEIVASAGYQGVELVGESQHWSAEETRRNLAQLRSLGLTIDAMSGVKTGFAVPDASAPFLADLEAQLNAAVVLGCPQLILLSGARAPAMSPDQQTSIAVQNLQRAADLAARHSIELLIEPIDRLEDPRVFLQSVAEAFPMVRSAQRPNLKVLYDFFHEQRGSGNLLEKLEGNLDLVGLVHIADVPGRHEPGTGEINFPDVYRKLAELHYGRWIAMEFYPTADPVVTLRAARQQAEQIFARQRQQ
jgi:hydroxypyruvate isomerase